MIVKPKVSIIIPIHNTEKYLSKCLNSVFSQTLDDIEYIFIDDGSTDGSFNILTQILGKYPERENQIKVIRNPESLGIANVRNIGLKFATGEYIGWTDSDDWIEKDMFEKMYLRAKKDNSDIVWIDYFIEGAHQQTIRIQNCVETPLDCTKNFLLGTGNLMSCLWSKLVRRSLYDKLQFIPGQNMGEDSYASIILFGHAKIVSHINKPLYHYRYNSETSMSAVRIKEKVLRGKIEMFLNTKCGIDQLQRSNKASYDNEDLVYAKNRLRFIGLNLFGIRYWTNCYSEVDNYQVLNLPIYERIPYKLLVSGVHCPYYLLLLLKKIKMQIVGYKMR